MEWSDFDGKQKAIIDEALDIYQYRTPSGAELDKLINLCKATMPKALYEATAAKARGDWNNGDILDVCPTDGRPVPESYKHALFIRLVRLLHGIRKNAR